MLISCRNTRACSALSVCWFGTFTATSFPRTRPLYTVPYDPVPIFTPSWISLAGMSGGPAASTRVSSDTPALARSAAAATRSVPSPSPIVLLPLAPLSLSALLPFSAPLPQQSPLLLVLLVLSESTS